MTVEIMNYQEVIKAASKLPDPQIFTDRGWGDNPLYITLINDGDGQDPKGEISKETFELLKKEGKITDNVLDTYKSRTLHIFN